MVKYNIEYKEVKNETIKNHANVRIATGSSNDDLKLAKKNTEKGEVDTLVHYRKRNDVIYRTLITLKDRTSILIDGGLATGFIGNGPSAFKLLLIHLGVEEKEAEEVAERSNYNQAQIKITFY